MEYPTDKVKKFEDRVTYHPLIPTEVLVPNQDVSSFSECVECIRSISSVKGLQQACLDIATLYGYDHVAFAYLSKKEDLSFICYHITNCDSDWFQYYQKHLLYSDPFSNHSITSVTPMMLDVSNVPKEIVKARPDNMMKALKEFNVKNAISIPCKAPTGQVGSLRLMTFNNHKDEQTVLSQLGECQLLLNYLFESALRVLEPDTKKEFEKLTKKEEEVINLIAIGKTNYLIAQELNVSENTVATHLKNIYKKLDANNRQEALIKASRKGLDLFL